MSHKTVRAAVLAFVFVFAGPRWAGAGVGDAVPLLNGTSKAKILWSTGGFATSVTAAAVFSCTSTEKSGGKSITWGVEVFDDSAVENDVTLGEGVVTASAGSTWFVTTRDTVFFEEDSILNVDVPFGSARILSTSSKLICTAYLVDRSGSPPTMMMLLPLFKKGKQGGQ